MTIGFTGLLTIVFIVLKLCGVITWSWLWVLSPIWIGILIGVIVVVSIYLGAYIKVYLDKKKREDIWQLKY